MIAFDQPTQANPRYRALKRALAILFLLVILYVPAGIINAADGNIIRVGYDMTGALLYKDKDGEYRGYNIDFLYEIAKYTGWQYEFVPYAAWGDAIKAVTAGDIDILPTVLKSPERNNSMLFSNRWMGLINVAVVVPKDDRIHFFGDLKSLQGTRIGMRLNTLDASDFMKWAIAANLSYVPKYYSDNKELLEALDAGNIDAAALSYVGRARKYRAVATFAPQEMYFAITPGKPDVKVQLDAAMGQIANMNPDFISSLMTRMAERETNPLPVFSLSEKEYIDAVPSLRVTFRRNAVPFSFIDEKKTQWYFT